MGRIVNIDQRYSITANEFSVVNSIETLAAPARKHPSQLDYLKMQVQFHLVNKYSYHKISDSSRKAETTFVWNTQYTSLRNLRARKMPATISPPLLSTYWSHRVSDEEDEVKGF